MTDEWQSAGAPGRRAPGGAGQAHRLDILWLVRQIECFHDADQASRWREALAELAIGDIPAFVELVFGALGTASLETQARRAVRNQAIRKYREAVCPDYGAWAAAVIIAQDLTRFRQRRPNAPTKNILSLEPPRLFLEIATQAIDRDLKTDSIARIIRQSD